MTSAQVHQLLAETPPWNRMREVEREVVAGVLQEVRFGPQALVQPAGEPLSRLLWRTEGSWSCADEMLPPILGLSALLRGDALPADVVAGPEGVNCLALNKGHFFTINSECPALLLGWMSLADVPSSERPFR